MEDCKNWTGRTSGGYGVDRGFTAHRRAWEDAFGIVPEGMIIHHVCENTLCVNPDHLVAVTYQEHRAIHPVRHIAVRKGTRYKRNLLTKDQIITTLKSCKGVISRTAMQLEVSRNTIYDYMEMYNIKAEKSIKKSTLRNANKKN